MLTAQVCGTKAAKLTRLSSFGLILTPHIEVSGVRLTTITLEKMQGTPIRNSTLEKLTRLENGKNQLV